MPRLNIGRTITSSAPGAGGVAPAPQNGFQGSQQSNKDVGIEAINEAKQQIDDLVQESKQFTDVEALSKPFTDAFDQFSSTAEEVFLNEVRQAEDDLGAFINNNPDVRGAVNLTVARQIKGDIFNSTLEAASAVNAQLAQGIFAAQELASQNFATVSTAVTQATTQLAGATADFVASLTSSQAQVYSANLNHAAAMAQVSANRDIAALNAATSQRGQDQAFDIAQLQAATQLESQRIGVEAAANAAKLAKPGTAPLTPTSPSTSNGNSLEVRRKRIIGNTLTPVR